MQIVRFFLAGVLIYALCLWTAMSRNKTLEKEVIELQAPAFPPNSPASQSPVFHCCHFCGRAVGAFSRLGFLRERRR
jgi:hypothetical protein